MGDDKREDPDRETEGGASPLEPSAEPPADPFAETLPPIRDPSLSEAPPILATPPPPPVANPYPGLTAWLVVIILLGVGGLFLGFQELAILLALSGLFVTAQAADMDSSLDWLYYSVAWVVPVGGAMTFFLIPTIALQSDVGETARTLGIGASVAGGVISLLTIFRSISNALVDLLFRGGKPTHVLRLAARFTLLGILFVIPGMVLLHDYLWDTLSEGATLFDRSSLGGGLVGYVALALAGVGFMVRRDLAGTFDRLGIRGFSRVDLAAVAIGVVGIFALNAAADWLQHTVFPTLWEMDHRVNERLVAGLGPSQILLLGLSAGIGEEITLRGALQPRLGVVLTAFLFACLHIQYTWFGLVVIFLLGLILGVIRLQTSTTVAMAVHVIYDVLAVITELGKPPPGAG